MSFVLQTSLVSSLSELLSTGHPLLDVCLRTGLASLVVVLSALVSQRMSWIRSSIWVMVREWVSNCRLRCCGCCLKAKHSMVLVHDSIVAEAGGAQTVINPGNATVINGVLNELGRVQGQAQTDAETAATSSFTRHEIINQIPETGGRINERAQQRLGVLHMLPQTEFKLEGHTFKFSNKTQLMNSKEASKALIRQTRTLEIQTDRFVDCRALLLKCRDDEIARVFPSREKQVGSRYFRIIGSNNMSSNGNDLHFAQYSLATQRTFASIFSEHKQLLCETLHQFETKTGAWDPSLERPYKFFMMLHGAPGVGKSSLIKALLNETKRDVIAVDMRLISSDEQLLHLFVDPILRVRIPERNRIEPVTLPINRRILVFEDMDCGGVDVIGPRASSDDDGDDDDLGDEDEDEKDEDEEEKDDNKEKQGKRIRETRRRNNKCKRQKTTSETAQILLVNDNNAAAGSPPKPTLSGLLNVLDGILEPTGLMAVITTNKLSKFDPAIFRPGRMDLCLHLGAMPQEQLALYLVFKYGSGVKAMVDSCRGMLPNFFMPSAIERICQVASSFDDALKILLSPRNPSSQNLP